MANKRRKFTPEECELMKKLSGIRVPRHQMCQFFKNKKGQPYTDAGFEEAITYCSAARNAIIEGRSKASTKVRNTLFQLATGEEVVGPDGKPTGMFRRDPDMSALRFWCETQEGFKRADAAALAKAIESSAAKTEAELKAEIEARLRKRALTEEE